jgi:hypothetical protein
MITTTAPGDKSNMLVTTSHPGTWTRTIDVYVPPNYVRGAQVPFIVIGRETTRCRAPMRSSWSARCCRSSSSAPA